MSVLFGAVCVTATFYMGHGTGTEQGTLRNDIRNSTILLDITPRRVQPGVIPRNAVGSHSQ